MTKKLSEEIRERAIIHSPGTVLRPQMTGWADGVAELEAELERSQTFLAEAFEQLQEALHDLGEAQAALAVLKGNITKET